MAFDNLASAFAAGKQAAPQSPFGMAAGNVMDLFKKQQETGMNLAMTAALFKGQKDYEYNTDPTKIEAQGKLNSPGLSGGAFGDSGSGSDTSSQPSGAPPSGSPFPGAGGNQGTIGSNVATEATDYRGIKHVNQKAIVDQKAAEELVAQRSAVQSNANAVDMLAELQKHYDNGVKHALVHSDPGQDANPVIAAATSQAQGRSLDLTSAKNPEWQLYQSFKKNTSFSADRNLYDEKGKLIGQQLDAGVQGMSSGYDSNTLAHAKISTLFDMAGRPIDVYNNKIRQTFGPNSQYEVHPKNEDYVSKTHDKYLALKSIQDGTGDAEKVKQAFKNKYNEDL